jgi:hypothetical protein
MAYEAMLSDPERIARVRGATKAIESIGGSVEIAPPTPQGMILVTLWLPRGYVPEDFLPGFPFYLV